jgi:hypothetical protein
MVELIKDYDLEVHYHPGKANVVADALSRKDHCNHLELEPFSEPLCEEMRRLNLEVVPQGILYALTAESNLYDRIVTAQRDDADIQTMRQKLAEGDPKYTCFRKDHQDVVWFGKRLVVSVDPEIKGAFAEVARGPGCALGLQLLLFVTLAQPKSLARTNFKAPKTRPPRNANFLRFFSARLVAALVRSLR